jgi:ribonuclease-3
VDLNLGNYLMLGKGEETSGGRTRSSSLADAFEALIGAVYMDSGLDAAREFILSRCTQEIEAIAVEPIEFNPKGELQEILQAISACSPTYEIIAQEGPDHSKLFSSRVYWEGKSLGSGEGASKKEAEARAARNALDERVWEDQQSTAPAGDQQACE